MLRLLGYTATRVTKESAFSEILAREEYRIPYLQSMIFQQRRILRDILGL